MINYTLVRHTGWSVGRNPQFENAVEERNLSLKEASAVIKAGGKIYQDYGAAHNAAYKYNYPDEAGGLIPQAKGKFVKRAGFDEEIFIPA